MDPLETNDDRFKISRKTDFMMKKKLFDAAPPTVESLLEERRQLYQRLQISRDELDSYIRYMHSMCDEKSKIVDELACAKTNNEMLTLKCKRLENQNKLLVKESSDLMKLLADFGPKELYNYSRTDPDTEEVIINKLRESVQVIFNENGKLHQEQDLLKNELCNITSEYNEAQKKVNELTKLVKQLEDEAKENAHYKEKFEAISHENTIHEISTTYLTQSQPINLINIIKGNTSTEGSERYFSVESITPPSFNLAPGDNSSVLMSSNTCKNSFNVDVFNEYPYKLKSCDIYSDSESQNTEDRSLYRSAVENNNSNQSSSNLYESCLQEQQQKQPTDKNDDSFNENSIISIKPTHSSPLRPRTESNILKNNDVSSQRNTLLDSTIDLYGLVASIKELHQITVSLFKLVETIDEVELSEDYNDLPTNMKQKHTPHFPAMSDLISNDDSGTSLHKTYDNLNESIKILKNELVELSDLLSKMNSNYNDVRDENEMLAKEIKALKYALTCRIELKNSRTTPTIKKCNCEANAADLDRQRKQYEDTISQLNQRIDELSDERTNLFSLITKIANSSDSGNE